MRKFPDGENYQQICATKLAVQELMEENNCSVAAFECWSAFPTLDGDVIIFVGIMDSDFRTESIEAFYVPKGTFVKLNPLIVHGTQYPVDKEDVHIVCMLPGRTFKNDMLSRRLETGEQIRITRGCKK